MWLLQSILTFFQLACCNNKPESCKVLIKHCNARPQDRCCGSGWVALHEAAYFGHHACLETLLQLGAACYSRLVMYMIMLVLLNLVSACKRMLNLCRAFEFCTRNFFCLVSLFKRLICFIAGRKMLLLTLCDSLH